MNTNFRKILYLYITLILTTVSSYSQSSKFKVVLDAGHGGKDFGASYYGYAEKNIALGVVLKLGKLLEKNPNIDVVYTRTTDVFVELDERANIANHAKATIFISIHCNANPSTIANGFETYVMGVARNKSNLEVAKLENDVISLEKDYKQNYEGYNPNSPESTIGMLMLQEEYRENSVELAARIQKNFAQNSDRKDRGVREAGFLVLRKIAMPRILVEMGFISNLSEGQYLASEEGQNDIAADIAAAVVSYKKEFYGSSNNEPVIEKAKNKTLPKVLDTPKTIKKDTVKNPVKKDLQKEEPNVIFKIQISASSKKIENSPENFNGLENISFEESGNLNKYFFGETPDYETAKQNLAKAKSKGYKSAYIVAFKNGKKVNVKDVIK
jgi:N-acetylmuramoyl-L-alanine amidase